MTTPTPDAQPQVVHNHYLGNPPAAKTNGFAIASLILGIWGFLFTPIPFFVGLFVGLVPDLLAIIFGIVALASKNRTGRALGIVGLILGGVAFLLIFVGSGWIW